MGESPLLHGGLCLRDARTCNLPIAFPLAYQIYGGLVQQRRVRAAVQGEEEDGLEEELHRGFSCDVGAVTVVTSQRRRGGQKVCTRSLHLTSVSRFERSKIGGSLLSSEGPACEVYIDAAPRVRVLLRFLGLTCLSQRSPTGEINRTTRPDAVQHPKHA